MLLAGCSEAGRLVELAPQLIAPVGGAPAFAPRTGRPATRSAELPPEQSSEAFDFEPAGFDQQGRRLYRIRIRPELEKISRVVKRDLDRMDHVEIHSDLFKR